MAASRTAAVPAAVGAPAHRAGLLDRIPTWVLVVAASAVWGANFVVMKVALRSTTPLVLGATRAIIGGVLLVAIAVATGGALPRRRADLRAIFWISFFMTTLSTAALIMGTARVSAGLASLLSNTMPLFMVVLALPLLGERASRRAVGGLLVGFAGTAVIAVPALRGDTSLPGVAYMLAASVTWAVGSLLVKRHDLSALSPVMVVGVQLLMSAVGLAVVAAPLESPGDTELMPTLLLAVAYLSVPGLALVFAAWTEILRRASAAQAGATAYLIPLFGVAFGAVFLDEALAPLEAAGALLVLAGVASVSARRRPAPPDEAEARLPATADGHPVGPRPSGASRAGAPQE